MELNDLRKQLDDTDTELLRLFQRRMGIVREVAAYKQDTGAPVYHPAREREILARVVEESEKDLQSYSKVLFSTILDLSRSYQARQLTHGEGALSKNIRRALENTPKLFPRSGVVACQGVEGAYSQQACDKLFSTANILYFKSFEGVFHAVAQGLCQYGILPIENSTYGTVNAVYDLMRKYDFHIVRSIKLKINHALLAKPGTKFSDIKQIVSHEQAIGQCSQFLYQNKDIKTTVCENTAMAAMLVSQSERSDIASISSPICAELYGLSVMHDDIQNSDSNFTRFICIARDLAIYPGSNRISLMLTVAHKPGSLYSMISKFSALGLNLTKLESRPIPGRDFEFMFYFDMDASVYSESVLSLLDELASGPEQFAFLGNYLEV